MAEQRFPEMDESQLTVNNSSSQSIPPHGSPSPRLSPSPPAVDDIKNSADTSPALVFTGCQGSGKSALIEMLFKEKSGDSTIVGSRHGQHGNMHYGSGIQEYQVDSLKFLNTDPVNSSNGLSVFEIPDDTSLEWVRSHQNQSGTDYQIDWQESEQSYIAKLFQPDQPEYLFSYENRKVLFFHVFSQKDAFYAADSRDINLKSVKLLEFLYYQILKHNYQKVRDTGEKLKPYNIRIHLFWHQFDYYRERDYDTITDSFSEQISRHIRNQLGYGEGQGDETRPVTRFIMEECDRRTREGMAPEELNAIHSDLRSVVNYIYDNVFKTSPGITSNRDEELTREAIFSTGQLLSDFILKPKWETLEVMMQEVHTKMQQKNVMLLDLRTRLPILNEREASSPTPYRIYYSMADCLDQLVMHYCTTQRQAEGLMDRDGRLRSVKPAFFDNAEFKFDVQKQTLHILVISDYLALVSTLPVSHRHQSLLEHNLLVLRDAFRNEIFNSPQLASSH